MLIFDFIVTIMENKNVMQSIKIVTNKYNSKFSVAIRLYFPKTFAKTENSPAPKMVPVKITIKDCPVIRHIIFALLLPHIEYILYVLLLLTIQNQIIANRLIIDAVKISSI